MPEKKSKKKSLFKRLTEGDLVNYLNYGAGAAFVVVMTLLVFGQSLGVFKVVGLDWMFTERGIYADCSKAENQDNPYCQPKTSRADRDWDSLSQGGKRAMPFNLHD